MVDGANADEDLYREYEGDQGDGQGPDYEDDPAMVGGGGGADEPENYQDEDDLYADIVPGLAQVDGEWDESDDDDVAADEGRDRGQNDADERWGADAQPRWDREDPPHSSSIQRWNPDPEGSEPPAATENDNMLDQMLADTPDHFSDVDEPVLDAGTRSAENGGQHDDVHASNLDADRGQVKEEGTSKRKHEPVRWEAGPEGGSRKRSRSDGEKEGRSKDRKSQDREAGHKEKKRKHKDKDKDKDKEKDKEREKDKDKDREKERDRDKDRSREKEKAKAAEANDKDKREKQRDRESERKKERERDREKDRQREREREREKERGIGKVKEKEKTRDRGREPETSHRSVRDKDSRRSVDTVRGKEPERGHRVKDAPRDRRGRSREDDERERRSAKLDGEGASRKASDVRDRLRAGREERGPSREAQHVSARPRGREDTRRVEEAREEQGGRRAQSRDAPASTSGRSRPDAEALEGPTQRSRSRDARHDASSLGHDLDRVQDTAMEDAAAAAALRQEAEDEEARMLAVARLQERERERDRERALERLERDRREFGGCYSAVLEAILQPLPKRVAAAGSQLLARLRAVEAVAKFQAAGEALARMHASGAAPDTQAAQVAIGEAASTLSAVAHALASSGAVTEQPALPIVSALQGQDVTKSLGANPEPDTVALSILAARKALALVAAVMHVPAVHATLLEQQGLLQPPTTPALIMAHLSRPLLQALRRLLAVLLSCAGGLDLLLRDTIPVGALLKALDPANDPYGPPLPMDQEPARGSSEHLAATLRASMAAAQAAHRLVEAPGLHSAAVADAVRSLAELLPWEAGCKAAILALTCVPGALSRLLDLVREPVHPHSSKEGDRAGAALQWRAGAMYGTALLQELVRHSHHDALRAWATAAPAVQSAVSDALSAAPEHSNEDALKKHRVARMLVDVKGRVEAVMLLREKGIAALITCLDGLLPPLVAAAPDVGKDSRDKKAKNVPKHVELRAAVALLHDTDKSGKVETALQLLHAVISSTGGPYLGLAAADASSIKVMDRALRSCTAMLKASSADDAAAAFAGDALDDLEVAGNRLRAVALLAAAARAVNALLQRLSGARIDFNSSSLLDALLAAHTTCTLSTESLAAMAGQLSFPGSTAVLQARQALAASLKCWIECGSWTPELMPTIFASGASTTGDSPLVNAQAPQEMLTSACMLADIFPAEWPPAGAARQGAGCHLPPAHMRYRAALARSFEPSATSLRRLLATAVGSEAVLFRGALVRLCARASGLGGGMGAFMVGPLMEELAEAAQPSKPLFDARRCLEVLVPLAYRPAIKAALLDAGCAAALGQLLARLVPAAADPAKAAEAGALITMALEIITVLCNIDVCLDPSLSPEQRAIDECVGTNEAGSVVAILLAGLGRLGGNAFIAKRLVAALAAHAPGRAALRTAVTRWQAQATGASTTGEAALQWAVSRLWQQGQDGAEASLRQVCSEVGGLLQAVATTEDEDDEQATPATAPIRFAAAVQAALNSGLPPASSEDELAETSSPEALIYDTATRMFWRNVSARAAGATLNKLGRKPMRYDIPEAVPVPAVTSCLTQGLTRPKHPRDARMAAGGPKASPGGAVKPAAAQPPTVKPAAAAAAAPPAKSPLPAAGDAAMPGADLPPVIAPPGRTRGNARARSQTGSLSRPTSIHVDDFQRNAGQGLPGMGDAGRSGGLTTPRGSSFSSHGSGHGPGGPGSGRHSSSRNAGGSSGSGSSGSGGPSLAQLLSDPAVVASLNNPAKMQQLLEKYPILMTALQSGTI
ncbi:g8050 [Coccomyxa elongata]